MNLNFIQNSWGPQFGSSGYFKIVRGKNICKIATDVLSPIVKPPEIKVLKELKRTPSICKRSGDVMRSTIMEKSFCIIESVCIIESASIYSVLINIQIFLFILRNKFTQQQDKLAKEWE